MDSWYGNNKSLRYTDKARVMYRSLDGWSDGLMERYMIETTAKVNLTAFIYITVQ